MWLGTVDQVDRYRGDLTNLAVATIGVAPPSTARHIRELGAVALLQLLPVDSLFAVMAQAHPAEWFALDSLQEASPFSRPLPAVTLGPAATRMLMAGVDPTVQQQLAPTVSVSVPVSHHPATDRNITCVLPGSSDRAVMVTAHYDHLGVGNRGSGPDSIFNGFSDNAAGVAMALGIAEAMQRRGPKPHHTVIFAFLTGEELGLLGSTAMAARPPWPLPGLRGLVNLDAGAPPGPPTSWRLEGNGMAVALASEIATDHGWAVTTSPPRPNTDHYPFAVRGVSTVFLIPGPAPYAGLTQQASDSLRQTWDRYHRPEDEWDPGFPLGGLVRFADYAYEVVTKMAAVTAQRP